MLERIKPTVQTGACIGLVFGLAVSSAGRATDDEFRVWRLEVPSPERTFIRIRNPGQETAVFSLKLNDRGYEDVDDILAAIRLLPDEFPGESISRKVWRFVRANRYHSEPLTGEGWYHAPTVFFNSAGFGLCDDAASTSSYLWKRLGFDTRVWYLGGHVVSEVQDGAGWKMFDADLEVFYRDRDGRVVGVETLVSRPALIRAPIDPLYSTDSWPYSEVVAEIYGTVEDNGWGTIDSEDGFRLRFILPPGGTLDLPSVFEPGLTTTLDDYNPGGGKAVPHFSSARLMVPAGWKGFLEIPLIIQSMHGAAFVNLNQETFEVGSDELVTYLHGRKTFDSVVEVLEVVDSLEIVYLLNPKLYYLERDTVLALEGTNVSGLQVALEH